MPDDLVIGFVGLGQMGGPMAANIASAGFKMICFDAAGTEAMKPETAEAAASVHEVAEKADVVFLSLPDGPVVLSVVDDLIAGNGARTVIDLSTVGPEAARAAAAKLAEADITYCDGPVSGGRAGAIAGTVTLIFSGPKTIFERYRDVFDAFTGNPFHVGDGAGQGQALKLLNNFLSATSMAATSEAVIFGLKQGLAMDDILNVVNVSTGRTTASEDKFVKQVATGKFAAGFHAQLLNKDVQLYLDEVKASGTPNSVGKTIGSIWQSGVDSFEPQTDFTRIYEFIRDRDNVPAEG